MMGAAGLASLQGQTCQRASAHLEGHELVVGFWSPGVDLHRVLQSKDQKFNPLIFHWRTKMSREASEKQENYTQNISRD